MANLTLAAVSVKPRTRVRWFVAVLLAVGVLGIALRFVGFSTRLFWTDEAITAMRVSGHTGAQLTAATIDGRAHPVSQVLHYLGDGPEGSLRDVARSLAQEDAQHAPLYYFIAALWTRMFGPSIASLRFISVLIGCTVPFFVGWLCFELYRTRAATALGFAFAAVSPVLVIYSQQAREYDLWAAFVAASTAALLHAARARTGGWWIVYALCAIGGLYSDPLFIVTIVAHAIYAAFCLRGKALAAFAGALAVSLAAFAPWAYEILRHLRTIQATNGWTATPWPFRMLAEKWIFNAGTAFFDLEYAHGILAIVLIPIFVLVVWALAWNMFQATLRQRVMAAALVAVPVVMVFLPDLVLHQHRSSVTRYGMALWIALIVCAAGFLAARVRRSGNIRALWIAATFAFLAAGCIASISDVRTSVWWDNRGDAENPALSRIINAAPSTLLVVADNNWPRMLALSVFLDPGVHVQVLPLRTAASPVRGFKRALLLAQNQDAPAFAGVAGPLQLQYASYEQNAQIREFRGTAAGKEYLSLWRFERYAGTPP